LVPGDQAEFATSVNTRVTKGKLRSLHFAEWAKDEAAREKDTVGGVSLGLHVNNPAPEPTACAAPRLHGACSRERSTRS
jgi:hypothetical protein